MTLAEWGADTAHAFAVALGGGGAVAIVAFALRTWLDKRVTAHYQREVETHRAALANDLEKLRQAAAASIEASRQGAARDLESFKAELTFGAEVRRQAAARKVEALLAIFAAAEPVEHAIMSSGRTTQVPIDVLNNFASTVRKAAHLVPASLKIVLDHHLGDLTKEHHMLVNMHDAGAVTRAGAVTQRLTDAIRAELGIEPRKETS